MTHSRVKSQNLYSLAHDDGVMEVRFLCKACEGTGLHASQMVPDKFKSSCPNCSGSGHTGTYRGKVPAKVFEAVKGDKSPGAAFNKLVRGNSEYKLLRDP